MTIKFWGTRGSIPTPGPHTSRYGGNTACIQVTNGDDTLILDAGTGIRPLGVWFWKKFGNSPQTYHILITHTHWDHIQGFPFFKPAFIKGNRILIYGYMGSGKKIRDVMTGQMASDYFPVSLEQMGAHIEFVELPKDMISIGRFKVSYQYMNHPGLSIGYRIRGANSVMVFTGDNEPLRKHRDVKLNREGGVENISGLKPYSAVCELDDILIKFVENSDVFISDAQYTPEEYITKVGWGHSPYDFSLEVAIKAGVKKFVLFHHDPEHDDVFIDAIVQNCKKIISERNLSTMCLGAMEGHEINL